MARNLPASDSLLESQAAKKPSRRSSDTAAPDGKGATSRSRIFIVDDHAMFREVLRQLIELEPDLQVCGEAGEVAEALRGIRDSKPDLVIADISLAGSSGIDLIKAVKSEHAEMPVLIVSMHDESLYAERALRAGAMGYLMKQEPARSVKDAIRKVLGGDMHLSEKMASSVIAKFMHGAPSQVSSPMDSLSDRELEVFRMLGQGKPVRQIAEDLNVAVPTINSFRNRIKDKLRLKSSTEVMLHAIQWVQGVGGSAGEVGL